MSGFHELAMPNGMLRVCTMNCGQAIGDKRSRADIMRECGDCVDSPNPPDPNLRIVELELEVATLRTALRNVLHALDAGATKSSMRCSLLGALNDSDARRG